MREASAGRFVISLVLSAALGFAGVVALAPAAHAVTCITGNIYNTTDQASSNGRGVRDNSPGMTVYNDTITCARVSSMLVKNSTETRFVEVGWFEDPVPDFYDCWDLTAGAPKYFGLAVDDGIFDCFTGTALSTGVHGFTVKDPNQDGIWTYGQGGSDFWTSFDMGAFNNGLLRTNGEREGDASEPARSEFEGLERMDNTNTWHAWTSPFEAVTSDDPDFHDCIDAGDHIRVIRDGTSC
jgi:hypothetical protein